MVAPEGAGRAVTVDGLYQATSHVLGQEHARQKLAVLLRRQWLVSEGKYDRAHGAIAAGPSGSGKTFLIRAMCTEAGLPFAEVNATQYTDQGYVGLNLAQMFLPLIQSAIALHRAELEEKYGVATLEGLLDDETGESVLKADPRILEPAMERAASGIVLLDEFDKWMLGDNHEPGSKAKKGPSVNESRNVGRKLQAELLKMVEGSDVYVSDREEEIGRIFNTERVQIIAAGAFVGIDKIISRRTGRDMKDDPKQWERTEPKDFEEYGLLPELAGRLPVHIAFKPLQVAHVIQMLEEHGLLEEFEQRFTDEGCGLRLEDGAMQVLAKQALGLDIGARGLRHMMEQTFSHALFQASLHQGGTAVLTATMAQGHVAAWVPD